MNEAVERVAKVLAAAHWDGCETTEGGGDIKACVGRCECRDVARAVIDAMRAAPTDNGAGLGETIAAEPKRRLMLDCFTGRPYPDQRWPG